MIQLLANHCMLYHVTDRSDRSAPTQFRGQSLILGPVQIYSVKFLSNWNALFHAPVQTVFAAKMKRATELDWKLVQRICVFFCVKLGWDLQVMRQQLRTVFGQETLSKSRIRFWHREFLHGRTTLVDLQHAPRGRSGRSPANIQAVGTALQANKRLSVSSLHQITGIPQGTVYSILKKDLKLVRKCAKFVPKILTPRDLRLRYDCSRTMLWVVQRKPSFLKNIVTMDKSWVHVYDPELKCKSSEWLRPEDPCPMKALRALGTKKCMLVSFFDWKGMVHFEFVQGRTIDTPLFIQILTRMEQAMLHKRRKSRKYWLHMDNASPHTSRDTKMHLLLNGVKTLPHPPYSPDLSPNDFWFYSRLKAGLRGTRFRNIEALKDAVHDEISAIPSHEYEHCFMKSWPMRWARCVHQDGNYFEGLL